MAQRFVDAATQQLAPVYDQQATAIQSQVPAIQNLYNTLVQGLQTQYDTQLNTGVQQITEDASARGVLRSTLPVDARQALTTQLGQALMTSRGELAAKQAGDIANVNEKLGTLGIQRATSIADLARALETDDLNRQKFEYQKQIDQQQLALKQRKISASAAAQKGAPSGLVNTIYSFLNSKKGRDSFVSPETFRAGLVQWTNAGGSPSSFVDTFGGFVNPVHQKQFGGYY